MSLGQTIKKNVICLGAWTQVQILLARYPLGQRVGLTVLLSILIQLKIQMCGRKAGVMVDNTLREQGHPGGPLIAIVIRLMTYPR